MHCILHQLFRLVPVVLVLAVAAATHSLAQGTLPGDCSGFIGLP